MLALTTAQSEALAKRKVMRRIFLWCDALDLAGDPDPAGFWDDVGAVELDGKTYYGASLFSIQALNAKSDFSIPGLQITLSGVEAAVIDAVRAHNLAQTPITVSLEFYDVDTRALIPPLIPRFVGKIDDVVDNTPPAGDKGTIVFTCESSSRALTIKGTATRSPASMADRALGDLFFQYAAATKEQTVYFGKAGA